MKQLIIQALNNASEILKRQIPQSKKQVESISILDIDPVNLASFMTEKDIPDTAYFGCNDQDCGDVFLCWDIDIPISNQDKIEFERKRFSDIAFKLVYDLLIENNYRRIGFNSHLLEQFKNTTVYDMYLSQDFDRLALYYSLSFNNDLKISLKCDRESGRKTAACGDQVVTLYGDRLKELAGLPVANVDSFAIRDLGKKYAQGLPCSQYGAIVYIDPILWDGFYLKNRDLDENGDPY